jgi:hypothetical protein
MVHEMSDGVIKMLADVLRSRKESLEFELGEVSRALDALTADRVALVNSTEASEASADLVARAKSVATVQPSKRSMAQRRRWAKLKRGK